MNKDAIQNEPGFQHINLYYMLGSMAEILSLQYLDPQAIYSMYEEQSPVCYHLNLFEFVAH